MLFYYAKPSIMHNRVEAFLLKSGTRKGHTLTCMIFHGLVVFFSTIREEKEMSSLKVEIEDMKLQLL